MTVNGQFSFYFIFSDNWVHLQSCMVNCALSIFRLHITIIIRLYIENEQLYKQVRLTVLGYFICDMINRFSIYISMISNKSHISCTTFFYFNILILKCTFNVKDGFQSFVHDSEMERSKFLINQTDKLMWTYKGSTIKSDMKLLDTLMSNSGFKTQNVIYPLNV